MNPETYTQVLNALTSESIIVTNLTGTTIASVTPGTPVNVHWTLPHTFAISNIRVGTSVHSTDGVSTFKCDDMGQVALVSPTATSTNITVPAQCNGHNINWGEIYIQVYGINGELTQVYYEFQ